MSPVTFSSVSVSSTTPDWVPSKAYVVVAVAVVGRHAARGPGAGAAPASH